MKNLLIKLFLVTLITILCPPLYAQDMERSDMLRSNGLIYIVIGVLVILFLGLFLYLFVIDQKLSKFEKKLKK